MGEQLGGFVVGDAAAGRGHGDLRPARSRVVGRGGPPCFGGRTRAARVGLTGEMGEDAQLRRAPVGSAVDACGVRARVDGRSR
jgi:hypothetical protein